MPRAATTPGLDAGTLAEVRVAQAWFWDGYFVRRGVDLQHRFGTEVSTVTDIDVLGFAFDPSCSFRKQIGEVKSGKSSSTPRPLDRALWMRGLRELVNATSGEITTAFRTSGAIRDACRRLGASVQHLDDLTSRERRLDVASVADVGSVGETIAVLRQHVSKFAKGDQILERAWWFLVSEVWFLEPFDALKRTLGVIRELAKRWPPEAHTDAMAAARWFMAEAVSVATLHLAIIAGEANTMDVQSFQNYAAARLATGDLPFHGVQKLSERVDVFVGKVLASVDAPAEVVASTIGAFAPMPPEYTEPLLELISRLAAEASITALLPRQMDVVVFERLVKRRVVDPAVVARLHVTPDSERLMRLIGAFLRGQFALPEPVQKVLMTPLLELEASTRSAKPGDERNLDPAEGPHGEAVTGSSRQEATFAQPRTTLFDDASFEPQSGGGPSADASDPSVHRSDGDM